MIKAARIKAGLTQAQLSKKMRLDSTQFVSNMEREVAPIPANRFKILNRVLGIPIKALVAYNVTRYKARLKRSIDASKA